MAAYQPGPVPRGIEVLVKKAAVDAEFQAVLLEHRAEAAGLIGLELDPSESLMLRAVAREQLEAIIARTDVPQEHRRAFLGQAAAAMLAAVGVGASVAAAGLPGGGAAGGIRVDQPPAPTGIRPDLPEKPEPKPEEKPKTIAEQVVEIVAKTLGIELPKESAPGDRPEAPPVVKGIRPDLPEKPGALAISREKRLVEDLRATPEQMVALRKAIEEHFEIKIPYQVSRKIKTVGDLIDVVEEAVRRREEAAKKKPVQPSPAVSRGSRPDVPPATFGIQPDRIEPLGGVRPQ